MSDAPRFVVALSGSPRAGSNTDVLVEAALLGAREAGAETLHLAARDLRVMACQACGPDPTGGQGYCVYRDDMDQVYPALERATGVLVATPVYFSGVSAQLKLVIDRCNCVTPVIVGESGRTEFRRQWARTRRGGLIVVLGASDTPEPSRLTARGFLSWVGGRLLETLVYRHDDVDLGAVAGDSQWIGQARALGKALAGPPLEPAAAAAAGGTGLFTGTHVGGAIPPRPKPGEGGA
ncbi:MAG: flavodoxin family protein [Candidatus Eisenbacteria bacterium]